MLSRQHLKAITEPLVMATSESAEPVDADVVHEVTVPINEGPQPEAWAVLTPPGEVGIHHQRLQ